MPSRKPSRKKLAAAIALQERPARCPVCDGPLMVTSIGRLACIAPNACCYEWIPPDGK